MLFKFFLDLLPGWLPCLAALVLDDKACDDVSDFYALRQVVAFFLCDHKPRPVGVPRPERVLDIDLGYWNLDVLAVEED